MKTDPILLRPHFQIPRPELGLHDALVPGRDLTHSLIWFVGNHDDKHTVIPLRLIRLDAGFKEIGFACACGQPNCTREDTFKGHWTGNCPSRFKEQK